MSRRARCPSSRQEEHAAGLPYRVAMMPVELRRRARELRREGRTPEQIARDLDATMPEVIAALGALRGKRDMPNHLNLSVTRITGQFFRSLAEPGEPTWSVMDRVAAMIRQQKARR